MNEQAEMVEKISIIVPVYNAEPFLRKCLKSLINQTYKNIEIIVINDGSPDNSGAICDAFAKEDNRIKVIHQANKGLCGARNAGIAIATGEYFGFVDADDWVDLDMFEYLLSNAKKYDSDITVCPYYRVMKNKTTFSKVDEKVHIYDRKQAIEEMITKFSRRPLPCNRIYKKDIFEQIMFPEGHYYEGTYVMHKMFALCERIVFLSDPKYYYLKNSSSIVNTPSIKNQSDCVYAHIVRYNDLHEEYHYLKNDLLHYITRECMKLLTSCHTRKNEIESNTETMKVIQSFINEHWDEICKMPQANIIVLKKLNYFRALNNKDLNRSYRWYKIGDLGKQLEKKRRKTRRKMIEKIVKPVPNELEYSINMDDLTSEDKKTFNRLHETEIQILDEFVRICDKHNLKYYLYGGTLLGAVRHKGFIPWDDDIDIVMLRDDYEKFGKVCQEELHSDYFYQTNKTDSNFTKLFAKIRLNNTYVREKAWDHLDMHKGIFIDILPLDNFPEEGKVGVKILKKFNFWNTLCHTVSKKEPIKFIWPHKRMIFKYYLGLPKEKSYKQRAKLLAKAHSFKDSKNVCSFGSHYRPYGKRVLRKVWFSGDEYMEFEGRKYRVPTGWKEYLVHLFGRNYMELPPVEQRINHFNFYEIEFNTNNERGQNK